MPKITLIYILSGLYLINRYAITAHDFFFTNNRATLYMKDYAAFVYFFTINSDPCWRWAGETWNAGLRIPKLSERYLREPPGYRRLNTGTGIIKKCRWCNVN